MIRFDWQNSKDEIKELRSHATKDFRHPTELGKCVRIQSSGLLHAFTDEGFEDIEKELQNFNFPEGKSLDTPQNRHFIMDLPDWGEARVEDGGKVVRVFDKKGVSIFRYSNPIVIEKDKSPFKIVDGESIVDSEAVDEGTYEVESGKLFIKLPQTLKNKYPLRAYDLTDTSSTNNKDANIRSELPNNNYGPGDNLYIRVDETPNQRRSVMEWTLSAGSGSITKIGMFVYSRTSTNPEQVDLHELTDIGGVGAAFVEAQVTWNIYSTGNSWTTPGGDFDATIVCHLTPQAAGNWDEFVVQGTGADNPLSLDFGDTFDLLLKSHDETAHIPDLVINWHSKEYLSKPYIEITYVISAPVTDGDLIGIAIIRKS